jgi:hypothetical protein
VIAVNRAVAWFDRDADSPKLATLCCFPSSKYFKPESLLSSHIAASIFTQLTSIRVLILCCSAVVTFIEKIVQLNNGATNGLIFNAADQHSASPDTSVRRNVHCVKNDGGWRTTLLPD